MQSSSWLRWEIARGVSDTLPQVVTDLPAGFSTLLMETEAMHICSGDMRLVDRQPTAAEQLCKLLSCAPDSYRRADWGVPDCWCCQASCLADAT